MFDFITLVDGYKVDHRRQYPAGTEYVYSNFTPRSTRVQGQKDVVFFGLQYFLQAYLQDLANETFFGRQRAAVVKKYQRFLDGYLGPNSVGVDHIANLHDLGYIPLRFKALPEGTSTPLKVPMFTVENTKPEFFWVTNYIETMLSNVIWKACTSATTARRIRQLLDGFALRTTGAKSDFVSWQGHDFSFRGMGGVEDAALSGAGHLLSFTGTDTVPAIQLLEQYYHGAGLIGGSVAATEHSVMCAGGPQGELETFDRLLSLYPSGIVSVVSDTWDLWKVLTDYLPALKDKILARPGKLVIRPDSGNPADILCGDGPDTLHNAAVQPAGVYARRRGVVQSLWDIFGGTVNAAGYKELDPHIGAIYGDSMNDERITEICQRLEAKGFASTNVVFGIGSFNYQYVTRDTYGFAMKATAATVNGQEHALFKDPVTDDGGKRSARGRLVVTKDEHGGLQLTDGLNRDEAEKMLAPIDQLQTVWQNGRFVKRVTLDEVRGRVQS